MGAFRWILGVGLIFGLVGPVAGDPEGLPVRVITEDSPPGEVIAPDGRVSGPTADFVRELMKGMDVAGDIEGLPWKRGYEEALRGPRVALFETSRTPEREPLFQWVGPIKRVQFTFFAKKDSAVLISSLDDAKKAWAVVVYRGDSKEGFLKASGFTNVLTPATPEAAFKMLMYGRADLWFFSDVGAAAVAREAGYSPDDVKPVFVGQRQDLYIAFSNDTPLATVRAWQARLDLLKRNGTMARFYRGTYPDGMISDLSRP